MHTLRTAKSYLRSISSIFELECTIAANFSRRQQVLSCPAELLPQLFDDWQETTFIVNIIEANAQLKKVTLNGSITSLTSVCKVMPPDYLGGDRSSCGRNSCRLRESLDRTAIGSTHVETYPQF